MERRGEEVHIETDEARVGSTPHIVRWVLGISLLAAIVVLSIIWMTGAATQDPVESEVEATARDDVATYAGDAPVAATGDAAS